MSQLFRLCAVAALAHTSLAGWCDDRRTGYHCRHYFGNTVKSKYCQCSSKSKWKTTIKDDKVKTKLKTEYECDSVGDEIRCENGCAAGRCKPSTAVCGKVWADTPAPGEVQTAGVAKQQVWPRPFFFHPTHHPTLSILLPEVWAGALRPLLPRLARA